VRLAKADAFQSLGLSRREASWAIKALKDDELPLFAESDRRAEVIRHELTELPVELPAMQKGREVVEDYRSHGLSLRPHPLAFLRDRLNRMGIIPCADLKNAKNGQRVTVARLVMVRQRPGSAKGVMFITLEDGIDIANLVIWPSLFEKHRPIFLGAQLLVCRGKVQTESGVIHVVAEHVSDRTDLLRQVGGLDEPFTVPTGRGDEAKHGGGPDSRDSTLLRKVRDIFVPDLHIDTLTAKGRNFR
jgi:error-prone DNA polymerase